MRADLTIKNFRVFDHKQGATIKLAPLTILTGCNSSGKSSVVKALLLLKDFFEQMGSEKFVDCKLDFTNTIAKLGNFDVARNNKSNKGSKMSFAYQIYSTLLKEDMRVELTFSADKDDLLNNGLLDKILIKRVSDNIVIFDANILRNFEEDCFEAYVSGGYGTLDIKTQNLAAIVDNYLEYAKGIVGDPLVEFYADSFYYKNSDIVNEAIRLKSIFPLPLWEWTDNVAKDQVRNVINSRIIEQEKINQKKGDVKDFKYHNQLNALLDVFESSKYETLREFLSANERTWLKDIKHQQDYNAADRSGIFLHRLKDFASALKVFDMSLYSVSTVIDKAPTCDSQEESSSFLANRFGTQLELLQEVDNFVSTDVGRCNDYFVHLREDYYNSEYVHKVLVGFRNYYKDVMEELLSPKGFVNLDYVGDASLEINRLYTKDAKSQLFFNYAQSRLDYIKSDTYRYKEMQRVWDNEESIKSEKGIAFTPNAFINKWLKELELGDHLTISTAAEGLGVIVKIHKDENDKKGRLLADEGLGVNKLVSILTNLEYHIVRTLSQRSSKYLTLAIEEPESHLHPRFQSKLAEMFVDAYKNYGVHVIVETHSEYLIRKLQTLVAKKELGLGDVSIQYLYNPDIEKRPKGEPQVKDIEIRNDGTLRVPFGPGFFDEADNLAMDLLTIKVGL